MNRHRTTRALRRHGHRRPHHRRPAELLRRRLSRARDLDVLHEHLRLVEHAHLFGHLDLVERSELLDLHRRRWHALVDGGAA